MMKAQLKTAALLLILFVALEGCIFFVPDHDRFHHHRRWWYHSSLQQDPQPASDDLLAQNALNFVETGESGKN